MACSYHPLYLSLDLKPGGAVQVASDARCTHSRKARTPLELLERTMRCPRRLRLGSSGLVAVGRKGSGTSTLVHAVLCFARNVTRSAFMCMRGKTSSRLRGQTASAQHRHHLTATNGGIKFNCGHPRHPHCTVHPRCFVLRCVEKRANIKRCHQGPCISSGHSNMWPT